MGREKKELHSTDFGEDFVWGVSSSAYQTEGAVCKGGKGLSIWDNFSARKNTIRDGHKAYIACDFYNRFPDDISLMNRMNIRNFRFSISWPRIIPNGTGAVSSQGIDFYNRLIDTCLENNIEPWITLYHWDLPNALQRKGGWTNREIVSWFEEYSEVCAHAFGDRVRNWMVLNEPMVFTGAGYFLGVHAPGLKGLQNFLPAIHHATLCQAVGGKVLREIIEDARLGTTFSCSHISSYSDRIRDVDASRRADALLNRLFIEPALGMGYPVEDLPILKKLDKFIMPGDMDKVVFDYDFIGIQNYTREVVRYNRWVPYIRAEIIGAEKRAVPSTLMNWEVYPEGIYKMIEKFSKYKDVKSIIVTENGAAFEDEYLNGCVDDQDRLSYLKKYIQQVHKARSGHFKIDGYFVWTFTDNFEWAEGYHPKFGLVYTNPDQQERIIKASGKWYSEFLNRDN